jgi:hypothetical protein
MKTYKFPQFNAEITDPTVTVQSVNDNLKEKTCSVDILLTNESAQFGVNLNGFTYSDTWEDADVYAWVQVELEKFAV